MRTCSASMRAMYCALCSSRVLCFTFAQADTAGKHAHLLCLHEGLVVRAALLVCSVLHNRSQALAQQQLCHLHAGKVV